MPQVKRSMVLIDTRDSGLGQGCDFKVKRLRNTTTLKIGDRLSEREVDTWIRSGVIVDIVDK